MPKKKTNTRGTAWKKTRKTEYMEQKLYQYYIFSEGEKTEPNYFNGFKRYIEENPIYRDMVNVVIMPCGAETLRVLGKAERYVEDHQVRKAQIWCVYDKDSFPDSDFNSVVDQVNRLNQESK